MDVSCETLSCNYVTDFKAAWRKIKRRIWRLPYSAHNVIVHNLSYDIDHPLDTTCRMTNFVCSCLNHSNIVCRSLLSSLCSVYVLLQALNICLTSILVIYLKMSGSLIYSLIYAYDIALLALSSQTNQN